MNKQSQYFTSESVSKLIGYEHLIEVIRCSIHEFKDSEEFELERDQERAIEAEKKGEWYPIRHSEWFFEAMDCLINGIEWWNLEPYSISGEKELIKLRSFLQEKRKNSGLYIPIYVALTQWKESFFEKRKNLSLPDYTASYKKEMILAVEIEREYCLFNQSAETNPFKEYLACEQAIKMIIRWSFEPINNESSEENPESASYGIKQNYPRNTIEIGMKWLEKVYAKASDEEKAVYKKIRGASQKGALLQKEYLMDLHRRFVSENKIPIAYSYFERSIFRPFKKWITDK